MISINRNLAPFGKLNWKVVTQKCLIQKTMSVIRTELASSTANIDQIIFNMSQVK
jgi:hypothetical protein